MHKTELRAGTGPAQYFKILSIPYKQDKKKALQEGFKQVFRTNSRKRIIAKRESLCKKHNAGYFLSRKKTKGRLI